MCRDCYELDAPAPSLVERLQQDKEFYTSAGLAMGIPTGIFIAACILEYILTKRGSL